MAACMLLLANSLLLIWIGVEVPLLVQMHLLAATLCLAGLLVVRLAGMELGDRAMLLVTGAATGVGLFTLMNLCFLHLFDSSMTRMLGLAALGATLVLGYAQRSALSAMWMRAGPWPREATPALALALILAGGTTYGFMNDLDHERLEGAWVRTAGDWDSFDDEIDLSREPESGSAWGAPLDKRKQLLFLSIQLDREKLPQAILAHRGLSSFLVGSGYVRGDFDLKSVVDTFKIFSLLFWFGVLYTATHIARREFAVVGAGLWLILLSAAFLGSINYPPSTLEYSSYRGLLGAASLGMYHNSTQLMSAFVGLAGASEFLRVLGRESHASRAGTSFGFAALLVSSSFFIKPSFYTVVTPPILVFLLIRGRPLRSDNMLGLGILAAAPLYWISYPVFFDVQTLELGAQLVPLDGQLKNLPTRLGANILQHPVLAAISVLVLSHALLFSIALVSAREWLQNGALRRFLESPLECVRASYAGFFCATVFVIGFVPWVLLIETGARRGHGNFGWGGQVGVYFLMILLVSTLAKMRPGWPKRAVFGVWGLHIWGGLLHFGLFVRSGKVLFGG